MRQSHNDTVLKKGRTRTNKTVVKEQKLVCILIKYTRTFLQLLKDGIELCAALEFSLE